MSSIEFKKSIFILSSVTAILFFTWNATAQEKSPAPSPTVQKDSKDSKDVEPKDQKHRLVIGDRVYFQIIEDPDQKATLTVSETGEVDVPVIGRVYVLNQTCPELAEKLKGLLTKKYYKKATVVLDLDTLTKPKGKCYIAGQVRNPGSYDIIGGKLALSTAIINAGGFTESADKHRVKVLRKNAEGADKELIVDVMEILEQGHVQKDVFLEPEDYVMVTQVSGVQRDKVYVYGMVRNPGPQEAMGDRPLTLSAAILNAGGFSNFGNGRKVKVFRKDEADPKKRELVVDVQEILEKGRFEKDVILQPGDRVQVPEKLINW